MIEQPEVSAPRLTTYHAASGQTARWFVPTWKWQVRLSWTNWTFGVYWGKIGRKYMIGIDLGPLEIVRVRSFIRSERAKHRPRR